MRNYVDEIYLVVSPIKVEFRGKIMVYSQNRTVAAVFFFFLIGLLVVMPQVSRAQAVLEEIIVTAERRDQNLQDVPSVRSGRRTGRPFSRSRVNACGVVTS